MPPRRSTRAAAAALETGPAGQPVKKATKAAKKQPAKKQPAKTKKGLSGTKAPDSSKPLGRVDPASKLKGKILIADDTVYDVMLNFVDVSKNSDKYFIIQAVEQPKGSIAVFTRWGRTGTAGSSCTEHFDDEEEAIKVFGNKFQQKTGVDWEDKDTYTPQHKKYLWVQIDHAVDQSMWSDNAKWQYWVGDGVDGKADGWYEYEAEASDVVEQLHHEWTFSAHLCQRVVASGVWEYLVDLSKMTQTNIKHPANKQRHIRRWTVALGDDQTPPGELQAVKDEEEEEDDSTGTPPAAPSVVAPGTPSRKTPTKRKRGGAGAAAIPPTPASKPPPTPAPKTMQYSVDPLCTLPNAKVHGDFTCMLNQTNVAAGANNNKYYRIQMLKDGKTKKFFVWTRWGRVGENGQNNLAGAFDEEAAIAAFSAKFKSKTGNAWDKRDAFVHKSGKYDLVDIDEDADDQSAALAAAPKKPKIEDNTTYLPSALDPATQQLISLIFDEDMFNEAMQRFDIDVSKMPLGNLSKTQVQKGYDVLTELKNAIAAHNSSEVAVLTSRFYTVIPHTFGRSRPPLIDTPEKLQSKFEMCDVLADIETAQEMLQDVPAVDSKKLAQNPLDEKYSTLHADLALIPNGNKTFKMIETYFKNTTNSWRNVKLENVWSVDGEKDGGEFLKASAKLGNRKLLWHGTNVAVVAAIMKGGLRIMPHSGGRVGKGIYLASEHGKSAGYVRPSKNTGIMFLVEAALGKVHSIQQDDSSLKCAPKGFDSILAKGRQEPDDQADVKVKLDGKDVAVPQAKPEPQNDAANSSFHQSEYLVYKESQQRLRYVMTFKW